MFFGDETGPPQNARYGNRIAITRTTVIFPEFLKRQVVLTAGEAKPLILGAGETRAKWPQVSLQVVPVMLTECDAGKILTRSSQPPRCDAGGERDYAGESASIPGVPRLRREFPLQLPLVSLLQF